MRTQTERDVELKFRKLLKRDALWMALIFILSWIGFYLIPFVVYMSKKGGW